MSAVGAEARTSTPFEAVRTRIATAARAIAAALDTIPPRRNVQVWEMHRALEIAEALEGAVKRLPS